MSAFRRKSLRKFSGKSPQTDHTRDLLQELLMGLNTPRALTVWLLYANDEHEQLVDLGIKPSHYCDGLDKIKAHPGVQRFRDDYCATSLLSKAEFLKLSVDRTAVAMEKFESAEKECSETNRRLNVIDRLPDDTRVLPVLSLACKKIGDYLGAFDPLEFRDLCRHSGGATVATPRSKSTLARKFGDFSITSTAYTLIRPVIYELTGVPLDQFKPVFSDGNRVTTVPKSAKTDRVIAIEPCWNMYLQLGIGSMIRRRLRRNGFDINTQERNQQLAQEAYTSRLTTVDFKAASDTISRSTVNMLMPSDWLSVMDKLRATVGVGVVNRPWYKYSTMGNGFTFELETLIFASVAVATCKYLGISCKNISVFGDDVIIPTDAYPLYRTVTKYLGFTVNDDKSFSEGLFFESCGSYWFAGVDVKPFYVKQPINGRMQLIRFANRVREFSHRKGWFPYCEDRFRRCWLNCIRLVPATERLCGPRHFGDSVISCNFDEIKPTRHRWRDGWNLWRCDGYVSRPITLCDETEAAMIAHLYRVFQVHNPDLCSGTRVLELDADIPWNNMFPAKGLPRYRRSRMLFSDLYNFGPWE